MEWQAIVNRLRLIRTEFDKSYKCLHTNKAPSREETVNKHLNTLFERFEQIRVLINVNYNRLTKKHQSDAEGYFNEVRTKLTHIVVRRGLNVKLPENIHEELKYDTEVQTKISPGLPRTSTEQFPKSLSNCDLPQTSTKQLTENLLSSDLPNTSTENSAENISTPENMALTVTQFLGLASKLLPDFDGKPENLQSFLDALALVDSIKETHEQVAINLIKTKLNGTARNLLSSETTIAAIMAKLKASIKGESVEVVSAKLFNVRQGSKTANAYAAEVETLTKALEGAYIADGVSSQLATKYSTQVAVKSLAKNASNERVRLIMESGNYENMSEAIAKFVNSCTNTATSGTNILYYKSNNGNSRGRGASRGRGTSRGRGSYNRGGNNYRRGNNYRGGNNSNRRGQRNYQARCIHDQGNASHPQGAHLGDQDN